MKPNGSGNLNHSGESHYGVAGESGRPRVRGNYFIRVDGLARAGQDRRMQSEPQRRFCLPGAGPGARGGEAAVGRVLYV